MDAMFIPASKLASSLGGNHRDAGSGQPSYQKYLKPFWTFASDNSGYSKATGRTKRYVLRPDAIAVVEQQLEGGPSARVVNSLTGERLTPADLPVNGVYRSSYSTLVVPSVVVLDLDAVDRKITHVKGQLSQLGPIPHFHRTLHLRHLLVARKWVEIFQGPPNLYGDFLGDDPHAGGGRLFGSGSFHVQFMPGHVRRELLGGMGLWDYDFKSCNIALLCALASAAGADAGAVKEYRMSKAAVHAELSEACNVGVDAIKQSFLALVYGATASPHEGTALGQALGYDGAKAFLRSAFVTRFRKDILRVAIAIFEASLRRGPERWADGGVHNVVGKHLAFGQRGTAGRPDGGQASEHRILNHVLQGYEAWCLNAALEDRNDLVCLVFDGWVGGKADVVAVSNQVREASLRAFGFALDMEIAEDALL